MYTRLKEAQSTVKCSNAVGVHALSAVMQLYFNTSLTPSAF